METNFPAIIRAHWKRFIWIWFFFPVAFVGTALIPTFSRYPLRVFALIDIPAFFVCYYIASKPVRNHAVTVGQGMLLVIVVPFVIWATMVFGLFGLVAWLRVFGPH